MLVPYTNRAAKIETFVFFWKQSDCFFKNLSKLPVGFGKIPKAEEKYGRYQIEEVITENM